MADRRFSGANDIGDAVAPLSIIDTDEAFETTWNSDAHCVQYLLTRGGDIEQPMPRLNKPILNKLRVHGAEVQMGYLFLDYDRPSADGTHKAWTPLDLEAFTHKLNNIADQWPMAWQWCHFYTTRGGARLVYKLSKPITPERFEGKHQWLCHQFVHRGIAIDCTVSDWTRLFRLPRVVRDGELSEHSSTFLHWSQPDNVIDAEELESLDPKTANKYGTIIPVADPRPEYSQARSLLYGVSDKTSKEVMTEWMKSAKHRLKNRECFPCIYEHELIAASGERDSTIHKYVGQAVGLLYNIPGTTPQHIYALFLDAVLQLEPDDQTPSWDICLWGHVCRIWAKERAQRDHEAEQVKARETRAKGEMELAIVGAQEWCEDERLFADEEQATGFLSKHLIANVSHNFYIMRKDGYFDSVPCLSHQIIPRIKALGMELVIPTEQFINGVMCSRSIKDIIDTHCTVVNEIRGMPQIDGGYVKDLGTPNATLVLPTYARNPALTPRFDADVDRWLRLFFGDNYEKVENWLAWAVAFDEGPICALSIKGDPGVGKKMLVQGLAEVLCQPHLASEKDLNGDFQYGLLRSPFMVINEGWPRSTKGKHPADAFRALVSGDPIYVQRKFMTPMSVKAPMRVIFTANNLDCIRMLVDRKNLSPEDRSALAVRLFHVEVGPEAKEWLNAHGGMKFTASPGRRWIEGDSGQPSDYIVARHLLYLHQHRRQAPGERLLVEGNAREEIMNVLRTQSGQTPLVIECLIQLLNSNQPREGICVHESRIFVLPSAVLQYFRSQMANVTRENLTVTAIQDIFRGLILVNHNNSFELPGTPGKKRWYELDAALLLSVAKRDGWKCDRLEKIVQEQIAKQILVQ